MDSDVTLKLIENIKQIRNIVDNMLMDISKVGEDIFGKLEIDILDNLLKIKDKELDK